jgi:hypothetical protein
MRKIKSVSLKSSFPLYTKPVFPSQQETVYHFSIPDFLRSIAAATMVRYAQLPCHNRSMAGSSSLVSDDGTCVFKWDPSRDWLIQ